MARELEAHLTEQCPKRYVLESYIKRWEAGTTGISARYQLAYAHALGIHHTDLFGPPPGLRRQDLPSARPATARPMTVLAAPGTVDDLGTLGEGDETERRQLLQTAFGLGAGAVFSPFFGSLDPDGLERLTWAQHHPARIDSTAVECLADVLATTRRAEDALGSAVMLRPALAQLQVIEDLVRYAPAPVRTALLDVAQQWAQFTAWLCRDTLDIQGAGACHARALEWATEIGDHTMISSVLAEKSWMATSAGRPGAAISLAQAAQHDAGAAPEQLTRAAIFEATAHAMAGDATAADRKLGEAQALAAAFPDKRRPWLYWMTPEWVHREAGIASSYLAADRRWHARAVTALGTPGSDGLWVPAGSLTFLAAAHAKAGQVDNACATGLEAATAIKRSGSRHCAARLAQVHTELDAAHPGDPRVAELADALR